MAFDLQHYFSIRCANCEHRLLLICQNLAKMRETRLKIVYIANYFLANNDNLFTPLKMPPKLSRENCVITSIKINLFLKQITYF